MGKADDSQKSSKRIRRKRKSKRRKTRRSPTEEATGTSCTTSKRPRRKRRRRRTGITSAPGSPRTVERSRTEPLLHTPGTKPGILERSRTEPCLHTAPLRKQGSVWSRESAVSGEFEIPLLEDPVMDQCIEATSSSSTSPPNSKSRWNRVRDNLGHLDACSEFGLPKLS